MAGEVISSNLTRELHKVDHYHHIYILLSVEILVDAIRQNKEICGINVNG